MTRRLLEINDVGVTVADDGGNLVASPGQIICGDGAREKLRVGRAASERRRINPRATHDRFWAALDEAPLTYAAGAARSNADLVWLHLRELLAALDRGQDETWIVVVPAAYDDHQLALLLGIARSLDLRVERLVSAPVLAASAAGAGRHSLIMDAHWHRFSTDRVVASETGLRLDPDGVSNGQSPGGRGLGALLDTWATVVNDSFVAQTRFDPSHDADIEQRLYNRLPEWLDRMTRGEDVVAELDVGEHRYRAELPIAPFIAAAEPYYRGLIDPIRESGADTLILRHRLAGLPGLAQHVAEAGFAESHWLDEQALVRTALKMPVRKLDEVSDAVPLTLVFSTTSMSGKPRDLEPESGAAGGDESADDASADDESVASDAKPTHILKDGSALAIDASGRALTAQWRVKRVADGQVVLAAEVDAASPRSATINGQPAEDGDALQIGDRIAIADDGGNGDKIFVLLRVADDATE